MGKPQPKTPECEKLRAVAPESQKIGEFIEWLREQGICFGEHREMRWSCENCGLLDKDEVFADRSRHRVIFNGWANTGPEWVHSYCKGSVEYDPEGFFPSPLTREQILARYFEIDPVKLENERRALLEWCQDQASAKG